eukprot:5351890-Prymnesium_polylepis.1
MDAYRTGRPGGGGGRFYTICTAAIGVDAVHATLGVAAGVAQPAELGRFVSAVQIGRDGSLTLSFQVASGV